jgi:hypothetical protein
LGFSVCARFKKHGLEFADGDNELVMERGAALAKAGAEEEIGDEVEEEESDDEEEGEEEEESVFEEDGKD